MADGLTITGGNAYGTGSKTYNSVSVNRKYGGGVLTQANNVNSHMALRNCIFLTNSANAFGGGMYDSISSPIVSNCTFSVNSSGKGGGMYNTNSASPIVNNCVFTTNTGSYAGGGMYNSDTSSPIVSSCSFTANTGNYDGGGMYNDFSSSPVISNCSFTANTGTSGSGGGIFNLSYSSPIVSKCTFTANTCNSRGGGMFNNYQCSPVISNCVFSANSSSSYGGGGMCNYYHCSPVISNCVFSANSSGNYGGGGMYNYSASVNLSNCTFSGNSASNGHGGGLYDDQFSTAAIRNCTFTANTTNYYGAGFFNDNGSVATLTNCVLWGNTAILGGSGIGSYNSTQTVSYSDVQGGYAGTGNLNTDPLFINPASPAGTDGIWGTADDGLQPAYCSPVLNAGSNTGAAATDITGAPRVAFTTVDMGAYEKQTAPPANTADQAALSTASANVLPFVRGCDDGTWTYYAIPGNADSIGFAVAWGNNTAAKAAATVSIKVDGANTVATNATAGTWAMRRYWNVDIGGQSLATPVKVRFYFDNNDALALLQAGAAGGLSPVSSIKWFKTVGTAYSPSQVVPNNINNGNFILLTQVASGIENNTYWVQFDSIVSFSGGTAMVNAGASSALPVTLIDFSAQKSADGRSALLNWDVAGEQGIKTYGVQRSADGISFQTIGAVPATGKSSYSFTDNSPVTGTDYYRLAMIDRDGSYSYSYVRRLEFTQKGSIAISPNPAHNTLTITNTDESLNGTEAVILDFSGRIVNRFTLQPTQTIQLSDWAAGIYLLRLASGEAMKLEKQ